MEDQKKDDKVFIASEEAAIRTMELNWSNDTMKEIYKQANSGGVLLSSMGNPKPLPVY